ISFSRSSSQKSSNMLCPFLRASLSCCVAAAKKPRRLYKHVRSSVRARYRSSLSTSTCLTADQTAGCTARRIAAGLAREVDFSASEIRSTSPTMFPSSLSAANIAEERAASRSFSRYATRLRVGRVLRCVGSDGQTLSPPTSWPPIPCVLRAGMTPPGPRTEMASYYLLIHLVCLRASKVTKTVSGFRLTRFGRALTSSEGRESQFPQAFVLVFWKLRSIEY